MTLEETGLAGLRVLRRHKHTDPRGFFSRLWCAEMFAAAGLCFTPVQISTSFSTRAGTLRGLHWQVAPCSENKLVCVIRGTIWDVAVDLRPDSATLYQWFSMQLDEAADKALFIPTGFAHGYVTLSDEAEVLYCIDAAYVPEAARGARFDDPACAIRWPRAPDTISEKDLAWPPLMH